MPPIVILLPAALQQIHPIAILPRLDPFERRIVLGKDRYRINHGFGTTVLPFELEMTRGSCGGIVSTTPAPSTTGSCGTSGGGSSPNDMQFPPPHVRLDEIFTVGLERRVHLPGLEG